MNKWPSYQAVKIELDKFKSWLVELYETVPATPEEVDDIQSKALGVKEKAVFFLQKTFRPPVGKKLIDILHVFEWWSLQGVELEHGVKDMRDRIASVQEKINYVDQILCISDALSDGFSEERDDFTVQQKKDLLLSKLYKLKKIDRSWDVELIFLLNGVPLDDDKEAHQIAIELEKSELITRDRYAWLNDLIKISVKGKALVEKSLPKPPIKKHTKTSHSSMDIFISHSSQDVECAKAVIELLMKALNIPAVRIRCTSVEGHRLPAGASTDELLKSEVNDCKVLIALISPNSINSAYVMFELGARWGQSKPLIPLVTSKQGAELLRGPLSGINALNSSVPEQVYQLVSDLETMLKKKAASASVYTDKVNELVALSLQELLPPNVDKPEVETPARYTMDVNSQIKGYCETRWPDDYTMQKHCITEQKDAHTKVSKLTAPDLPSHVFSRIMEKAVSDWPDDYTMQLHSIEEQIDAYRDLQNM